MATSNSFPIYTSLTDVTVVQAAACGPPRRGGSVFPLPPLLVPHPVDVGAQERVGTIRMSPVCQLQITDDNPESYPRRDCVGELVQVDGSEHWWFEDRGPQCTLLVFVDDATSRLMHLQFVESESTFAYFHAARAYLEAWGKPVAFYSDKHGVFRVNHPGALGGDGMTQFGRALHALNIDIICANSSPAKGRVERANKTLQDRLVKELRLAGVSAPWQKAMPCSRPSWLTTTHALRSRRRTGRTCTGRCAPATISTTRLPGKKNALCHRR
jgi:hypothetical protein